MHELIVMLLLVFTPDGKTHLDALPPSSSKVAMQECEDAKAAVAEFWQTQEPAGSVVTPYCISILAPENKAGAI